MLSFRQQRGVWRAIASAVAAASHTGNTNETTLASIALPPLITGDQVRVRSIWSYTSSANNKTLRARLGATSISSNLYTNTASAPLDFLIGIRGAASQVTGLATGLGTSSNSSPVASTIDVSAGATLTLNGLLANAGETVTLEEWVVELLRA